MLKQYPVISEDDVIVGIVLAESLEDAREEAEDAHPGCTVVDPDGSHVVQVFDVDDLHVK